MTMLTNESKTEALANANAHLQNAGLPTVGVLLSLLADVESLGLRFDVGTAYIRRGYVDRQTELVARIALVRDAVEGAR